MSAKQDRQGVRTAVDLERKYKFGERFAEVMGIATDAQKAAEEAKDQTANLTPEDVFNLLTNNGENQGLYRGEDGELYINASYIMSGQLSADLLKVGQISTEDGTTCIDMSSGAAQFLNGLIANGLSVRSKDTDDVDLLEISTAVSSLSKLPYFGMKARNASGDDLLYLTELFASDGNTNGVVLNLYSPNGSYRARIQVTNDDAAVSLLKDGVGRAVARIDSSGAVALSADKVNPGKTVLYSGSAAEGDSITVNNTAYYDLFAVSIDTGSSASDYDKTVLVYKTGNYFHGVGGYAGGSQDHLYFVSGEISGNTWTITAARTHSMTAAGSVGSASDITITQIVGVI